MSNLLILPPPPTGLANTGSISAGTAAATLGQVVFSNSNGVSFGVNGQTVTASVAGGGGGNTGSISAGTTRATLGEVVLSNSNGLTFGVNGQTVTGSHNGLTSQSNQALSGSNGSFTFQTATFGSSNGLHFYTTNGSLVGSYTVPTVPPETPFGVSAGSQSVSTGTVVFANSNGISFGMSNSSRITASHNGLTSQSNQVLSLFAVSNTTQSSSGTQNAANLSFNGAGIASVGISNGSVVISVPAGGGGGDGGVFAGVSTMGNTAGSTGTVSTGNFVLVGTNGISLSQSTGGAGSAATVSILGDQETHSRSVVFPPLFPGAVSSTSFGSRRQQFWPVYLEDALYISNLFMPIMVTNSSSAANSGLRTQSFHFGIYSAHNTNSEVLTRVYSTLYTIAASYSSNVSWGLSAISAVGNSTSYNTFTSSSAGVGLSSILHGARMIPFPVNSTLSKGDWWFALMQDTNQAGTAGNILNISIVGNTVMSQNRIGLALNSTNPHIGRNVGLGVFSAASSVLVDSANMSQLYASMFVPALFAVMASE